MLLSDSQRYFYETNGYLVVPNALTGDHLTHVRAAADRAEARWRQDTSLPGQRSAVLDQVLAPIEYEDELLQLLWHPEIIPVVQAVLGDDLQMIDTDYFITPPHTPKTHVGWHHDVGMPGVYHPLSTLMVKVFYLLSDVREDSGGTVLIPGSHRYTADIPLPTGDPNSTGGTVQMTGDAGTAYLFNGRIYHAATNNNSDTTRRVLIYNYGHFWMKQWPGYEPSEQLVSSARARGDKLEMQLLGMASR